MKRTLNELMAAPYNPRKITPEALDQLGRAMGVFGDLSGIIVNRRTGNVVGGHQRLKHLPPELVIEVAEQLDAPNEQGTIAHGHVDWRGEKWRYREVDVDPETEVAMNIAANQHGGEFDLPMLSELVTGLNASDFKMDLLGFTPVDLQQLYAAQQQQNFDPGTEDDQGKLDQLEPKWVACPHCGKEFDLREQT